MAHFSVRWIYELDADYEFNVRKYLASEITQAMSFRDRTGSERLVIYPDGRALIRAHYAWDGCTPKFAVFDIAFGTPDGVPNERTRKPKTYYASLVHDVLYQFIDVHLPIARRDADEAFFDLLVRDSFAPRYVYWSAVRLFGGLSRQITRRKRRYAGRRVLLTDGQRD